ncbi:MAG: ATP-binding cassette domain-containing protein [Clostridia bacterium]|nr:ATP-binding cassette domain-containing protein [Clostridia bacterium]MBQ8399507.1 ATP-binding cassette domain-containing protein [Clostridia bacterium]
MIEFKNVTKMYDKHTPALENVSLKIEDGEFVFIIGESGAGKSTLIKLLLREERASKGDIVVDGKRLKWLGFFTLPRYRRKIGFVFQDFRLFENMTVYENVAFAMRAVGTSRKKIAKRVPLLLKIVDLETKADRFPAALSGGEQQRVALARALANNPKYIIADEPTGNIDGKHSGEIMDMLVKISKMHKTVIVVTHEQGLVERFGQRVIAISRGHVVADEYHLPEKQA